MRGVNGKFDGPSTPADWASTAVSGPRSISDLQGWQRGPAPGDDGEAMP